MAEKVLEECLREALKSCIFGETFDASVESVRHRFSYLFQEMTDDEKYTCVVHREAVTSMMITRMRNWKEYRGPSFDSPLHATIDTVTEYLLTRKLLGDYAFPTSRLEDIENKIQERRRATKVFCGTRKFFRFDMNRVAKALQKLADKDYIEFRAFEFYPPCHQRVFGGIVTRDGRGRPAMLYENGSFALYRKKGITELIPLEILQIFLFVTLLLKLDLHETFCPITVVCQCPEWENRHPRHAKMLGL